MTLAYATNNLLTGLAAAAFTWSAGTGGATRTRVNDGRMDARYSNGNTASGVTLVIDLGSAQNVQGCALLNHNAAVQKTDAAVRVRSADDSGITVNVATRKAATTLTNLPPYHKDHVLQFATGGSNRRYWELTFTWTGTVTDFSIGELYFFVQTQLSRTSNYGGGEDEEIRSAQVDFYNGGSSVAFLGGPQRTLRLPFSDLSPTERAEQATLWRATLGPVMPFLFIESYEASASAAAATEQHCVYGRLEVPTFSYSEPDFRLYTPGDLIIRSLGREVGA